MAHLPADDTTEFTEPSSSVPQISDQFVDENRLAVVRGLLSL